MARIHADTQTRISPSLTDQIIYDGVCRIRGILLTSSNAAASASLTIKDGTVTVCVLVAAQANGLVIFPPVEMYLSITSSLKITTSSYAEGLLFLEY